MLKPLGDRVVLKVEEEKEEFIDYPHLRYAGAATFVADAGESAFQLFI